MQGSFRVVQVYGVRFVMKWGMEDNVRFMFFLSEDRSHWVGYMLPSWGKSYLWYGIEEPVASDMGNEKRGADLTLKDRTVIYCIRRRYLRLLEYDEVENCCRLGKLMAEKQEMEPERQNVLCVYMQMNCSAILREQCGDTAG